MLPIVTKRAIFLILVHSIYIHDTDAFEVVVSRVLGGRDADNTDYPYQVQLLKDGEHICGGSIINNAFILTAAHCVTDIVSEKLVTVRVGSSYSTKGGQIYNVDKIILHPKFWALSDPICFCASPANDIAVLKLSENLTYGPNIAPIKLPTNENIIINGQTAIATGWGSTSYDNGGTSDQLQAVTLSLIESETCNNIFNNSTYRYLGPITIRNVCADGKNQHICWGDSGGPLVSNGVQLGISSWAVKCGERGLPAVFFKVSEYLSFINNAIKMNM